ncbi:AMP-binding protein, partial [uncultured Thioclava sp.]|uniref:AMP-binding protein n=1 Tax=uncultured Thioclava sp. TaxID=473858 RepID=UPI0025EA85EB
MTNPLYDRLFTPLATRDDAFLTTSDGSVHSGREFLAIAARQANALTAMGLRPGDRLAVQVEKSPQALALYAACVMAGLAFLPPHTPYPARDL